MATEIINTGHRMLMVRAISNIWMIEDSFAASAEQMILSMSAHEILEAKRATQALIQSSDAGGSTLYDIQDGIAYIPIQGVMTKEENSLMAMIGGASTNRIQASIKKALDDKDVNSIMLMMDSPGGSVNGSFDLAFAVYRANKIKPVDAYIQDTGASACYLVASQARYITANTNAMVGSIGIITALTDTSKQDEYHGIKRYVITTGEHKEVGHTAEVTDKHIQIRQELADKLMGLFVKAVSKGRGMDAKAMAKVTNAKLFIGMDAKKVGLVDEIASLEQAHDRAKNTPHRQRKGKIMTEETNSNQAVQQQELDALADVQRWLAEDRTIIEAEVASPNVPATPNADTVVPLAQVQPAASTLSAESSALLSAISSAGITTTTQFEALQARAALGDDYLARLRMQTSKLAVVALGPVAGKASETTINLLGATELRAMAQQFEAIAVQAGIIPPLAGTPGQRTSASGDHPQVGRDGERPGMVADSTGTVTRTDEEKIAASAADLRANVNIYHL